MPRGTLWVVANIFNIGGEQSGLEDFPVFPQIPICSIRPEFKLGGFVPFIFGSSEINFEQKKSFGTSMTKFPGSFLC